MFMFVLLIYCPKHSQLFLIYCTVHSIQSSQWRRKCEMHCINYIRVCSLHFSPVWPYLNNLQSAPDLLQSFTQYIDLLHSLSSEDYLLHSMFSTYLFTALDTKYCVREGCEKNKNSKCKLFPNWC